ncbi:metallophosphoesterase [Aestuariibacter sp. AA17]|uniref:Metallophosphoesterase n=1 Tax=Fluctibacter corallii TaxID=2984329 RepID=A0ABT3A4K8_9ALTE|nr:metallophosphoesterase [Aestuariibacter sp. AA17]MCV2883598.1 metallophosphoesterase [Aestuariibacter sp. AA17]
MVKIVQISDCHLFENPHKNGYNDINPADTLRKTLRKLVAHQPDLLMVTGDISGDRSEASYLAFLHIVNDILPDIPMRIVIGNHDNPDLVNSLLAEYVLHAGEPVTHGNWHIHGLNSFYQKAEGFVSHTQLEQVKALVLQHPNDFHMLAVHHHPLPTHSWMDKHAWINREACLALIESTPQIRGLMHGHIHADKQARIAQCDIFAAPSTCWQFALTPSFAVTDESAGFRLFSLHPDGTLHTSVERI